MKLGGIAKRAMLSAALFACWASAGPSLAADAPVSLMAVEAPPQTALSAHVLEAASAYRAYMRKVAATPSKFKNGHEIETSLADGAAYEPGQLSRGAVAFAALVALQDPAFVAGVRQYGIRPVDRKDLADKIIANPGYATVMPGSAGAASLIQAALGAEGSKVQTQGKAITQAARDIQLESKWSKEPVKDRPARLAHAKTASAAPMAASDSDLLELRTAISGSDASGVSLVDRALAQPVSPPYSAFVTRALAVAAIAALGQGGDENDAAVQSLLDESSGSFCLNMSKLNLYQCLAVAKPWYEDMFCLGQHVLADTGQCIAEAAGTPATPTVPAAATTSAPTTTTVAANSGR